ncbi:hypothetical protein [Kocuria rosea]|uniref:hypothetical protein n=1 Tax=Kocuria rosea TaxID=1275 RepID=UPI0012FC840E|nr:hypothetical protein [Kocuria polaris]
MTIMLVLGAVLAVVCVVVLMRLYGPKRLDDRIRIRHRVHADGPTAVLGGSGAAHTSGGSDSGRGGCKGRSFDAGGGGGVDHGPGGNGAGVV